MKKRVIKVGGDGTIGITFDKTDKEWYRLERGDFIEFTIDKIYSKSRKIKYDKSKAS